MKCPNCGYDDPADANVCPHCDAPIPAPSSKLFPVILPLIAALLLSFATPSNAQFGGRHGFGSSFGNPGAPICLVNSFTMRCIYYTVEDCEDAATRSYGSECILNPNR